MAVTDVINLNGATEREVVQIAASLEAKSTHPVAQAIAKRANDDHVELVPISDFKSIAGKGVTGRFDGADFYMVTAASSTASNSRLPHDVIDQLETEGKTLTLVGTDTHVIGVIGLRTKLGTHQQGRCER